MSKPIPGVPESITRAAYISLFEAVGIEPRQTLELSFKADGVYATVFALDANGVRICDAENAVFEKHEIYIPVEDAK